jgi:hypothetical protein
MHHGVGIRGRAENFDAPGPCGKSRATFGCGVGGRLDARAPSRNRAGGAGKDSMNTTLSAVMPMSPMGQVVSISRRLSGNRPKQPHNDPRTESSGRTSGAKSHSGPLAYPRLASGEAFLLKCCMPDSPSRLRPRLIPVRVEIDSRAVPPRHADEGRHPRLLLAQTKAWMAGLRPP